MSAGDANVAARALAVSSCSHFEASFVNGVISLGWCQKSLHFGWNLLYKFSGRDTVVQSHRASAVGGVVVPVLGAGAEVFSRDGNPLDTRGPTDIQFHVRALAVPDA